ncbi:MAG: pyridoxamine 5'-phosphate oxidase family protein [Bacteroidales bacterium]|jgi:uncharacterized pyridoxamine 5'-phosphate oxidase family protein|nr:pyridoxamine 5'-phosphate oxidase family protein [Bacteroidales bacterium]
MEEVYEFLKTSGVYYLATVDGALPKVRPFGTVLLFEGRLYIQSGKSKAVSQQIAVNPHIAISAMIGGKWLRVEAEAVEDPRTEPKVQMLDVYPELRSIYDATDPNTVVWYLKDAVATVEEYGAEKKTYRF